MPAKEPSSIPFHLFSILCSFNLSLIDANETEPPKHYKFVAAPTPGQVSPSNIQVIKTFKLDEIHFFLFFRVRNSGRWYCWHKDAQILSIWWYREYSKPHGVNWWRWAPLSLSLSQAKPIHILHSYNRLLMSMSLWRSYHQSICFVLFCFLFCQLLSIALKIHITAEMNDELASIGGFKTEHRGLIDVKVRFETFK